MGRKSGTERAKDRMKRRKDKATAELERLKGGGRYKLFDPGGHRKNRRIKSLQDKLKIDPDQTTKTEKKSDPIKEKKTKTQVTEEKGTKAKVSDYMDKPTKDPYSTSALADRASKTPINPKKKLQRDVKCREIETYYEDGKFKWRPKKGAGDSQKVDEKGKGVPPKKKENTWEGKESNRPRPGSAGASIHKKLREVGWSQKELDAKTKASADKKAAKAAKRAELKRAREEERRKKEKENKRTGGE